MSKAPPAIGATPRRETPRIGLIASSRTNLGGQPALPTTDDNGQRIRWEGGIVYVPDVCGGGYALIDPCDTANAEPTPETRGARVTTPIEPYYIDVAIKCASQETGFADVVTQARQALDRITPKAVEDEFWNGTLSQAQGWSNPYLADAATAELIGSGTKAGVVQSLAMLQEYLANTGEGGRGMIHATRTLVTQWQSAGIVSRDPGSLLLLDAYENIVVPGVGYNGSPPGGGTADISGLTSYAYATDVPNIYIGDITVNPPADDPMALGTVVTEDNEIIYNARRPVAAYWDMCRHGYVQVEHGLCSFTSQTPGS